MVKMMNMILTEVMNDLRDNHGGDDHDGDIHGDD